MNIFSRWLARVPIDDPHAFTKATFDQAHVALSALAFLEDHLRRVDAALAQQQKEVTP